MEMTSHDEPGGPHILEDRPRPRLRRRAMLAGLAIGLASGAAGAAAGAATLPPVEDLRRMSAEELGVDPDLLDRRFVAPIVDAMTDRVEDRLMGEVRRSMAVAVASSAAVAVAGVAAAEVLDRRSR